MTQESNNLNRRDALKRFLNLNEWNVQDLHSNELSINKSSVFFQGVSHRDNHFEKQKQVLEALIQKSDSLILEYTPDTIGFNYSTHQQFRKQMELIFVLGLNSEAIETKEFDELVNEAFNNLEFYRKVRDLAFQHKKDVFVCDPFSTMTSNLVNTSIQRNIQLVQLISLASSVGIPGSVAILKSFMSQKVTRKEFLSSMIAGGVGLGVGLTSLYARGLRPSELEFSIFDYRDLVVSRRINFLCTRDELDERKIGVIYGDSHIENIYRKCHNGNEAGGLKEKMYRKMLYLPDKFSSGITRLWKNENGAEQYEFIPCD